MFGLVDRVQDAASGRASKWRNRPGNVLETVNPGLIDKRRFTEGKGVGALAEGGIVVLEDVIGVPFGASSDVIDVSQAEDGAYVYTVNVNAPTENMAEARALIDSGTGFSSYLTDQLDVESADIISTRVLRDTYQVKVKVS